jgi:hypothetical protein
MLFLMTISRMLRKRLEGKLVGSFSSFVYRKFLIESIPVLVSMFVYIDLALVVNTKALYGMCRFLSHWINVLESFRYDYTNGSNSSFVVKPD